MISELINELVSYRILLEEFNSFDSLELRNGDEVFRFEAPIGIGKLMSALQSLRRGKK